MNHRLLSAIVATAWVAGAMAQSVVIVDKESLPHTIPAKRIEDITFVKVGEPQPGNITFNSITAKPSAYGGGEVNLTLAAENGDMLQLNVFGSADAAYLQDGEYKVSAESKVPYSIFSDKELTYFAKGDTKTAIKEGKMIVSRSYAEYTITFDFNLENGDPLTGEFVGTIPNYSFHMVLPDAKTIKVNDIRDIQPGEFYIKLNDENWTYDCGLDFYAAPDSRTLPAGTYRYNENNEPGTFGPKSYIEIYSPYNNFKFGPDSDIVVSYVDGNINIVTNMVLADGRTIELKYQGPVEFPRPAGVNFSAVETPWISSSSVDVNFATVDESTKLALNLSYADSKPSIPIGEYTFGGTGLGIESGTLTQNGKDTEVKSGFVNIAKAGNDYDVVIELGLADGASFIGYYKGVSFGNYGDVVDINITGVSFKKNDDAAAGEYYAKMNDESWRCEMAIDFFADASTTSLPAGTYTYSADGKAGTFGPKSYVDTYTSTYYGAQSVKMKEGSTVTVSANGNMSGTLLLVDGRTINFTYVNPESVVKFNKVELSSVGTSWSTITFSNDEYRLQADLSYPEGSKWLPAGTYVYGELPLRIDSGYATLFSGADDNTGVKLDGGKIVITLNGDIYTANFDVVDINGKTFNAVYEGKMGTFGPIVDITISAAKIDNNEPAPGEKYVKLNDSAYSVEMALDFYTEASAEGLTPGTYTYSADNKPGTFGPKSYVSTSRPYIQDTSGKMAEGSTVTVTANGLSGKLILTDGRVINITYSGEIK